MFYGHPVEKLCTYQYSLVTLIPGLLQNLDDCGSPPLAFRAQTLTRPNSLRTSDRKSMMAYMGLPLDLFGNVGRVSRTNNETMLIIAFSLGAGRVLSTVFASAAA